MRTGHSTEEETQRPTSSSSLVFREIHIQRALSYPSKHQMAKTRELPPVSSWRGVGIREPPCTTDEVYTAAVLLECKLAS